jgi:hypothetical protein
MITGFLHKHRASRCFHSMFEHKQTRQAKGKKNWFQTTNPNTCVGTYTRFLHKFYSNICFLRNEDEERGGTVHRAMHIHTKKKLKGRRTSKSLRHTCRRKTWRAGVSRRRRKMQHAAYTRALFPTASIAFERSTPRNWL